MPEQMRHEYNSPATHFIRSRQSGNCGRLIFGCLIAFTIFCAHTFCVNNSAVAQDKDSSKESARDDGPFPQRFKVSDGIFDGGGEWFNTSEDISIKDLRGKIVLVDFWTYCCINCIHVLPDLKYLEKKYEKEIVVIGVHSAKFDNEKVSENIRQAIMRYEIAHPVVNDSEMTIWRNFRTSSWPTLALIDPEGYFIGRESGEGNRELFDQVIAKLIDHHRAKGTLNEEPFKPTLETSKEKATPLRYPGKVLVDEANKRLFIADSNHNRIVVSSLDGKLQQVIGTGRQGIQDGPAAAATFNHPQGMELVNNTLYVADTENHAIRTVDLNSMQVATLAGTGEQSRVRIPSGNPNSIQLNSPWALHHLNGVLYIAMAGPHQLWSHELGSQLISVYAGSGREDIVNGPLNAAALAQPSGITSDGANLFVVDSEGSAIRMVGTAKDANVTTIIGESELARGGSLFEFGDKDGVGKEARLQHPLGIACFGKETLFVADSYNHKIKRVNLAENRITTWLGNGKPGDTLDPPLLSEPGGVSLSKTELFIADTNNHRICAANLKTGALREIVVEGLKSPRSTAGTSSEKINRLSGELLPQQDLAVAKYATVNVKLHYPDGFKPNLAAPVIWKVSADESQNILAPDVPEKRREANLANGIASFKIPLTTKEGSLELMLQVNYQFCLSARESVCKTRTVRYRIPINVAKGHTESEFTIEVQPPPPKKKSNNE